MAAAAPTKVPTFRTYNAPVHVLVGIDPSTGQIGVSPNPFWIHPEEEIEWDCALPHAQHGKDCFTIEFKDKSPFKNHVFRGHGSRSGQPTVSADITKLYEYSVTWPGPVTLDPQGGVKP